MMRPVTRLLTACDDDDDGEGVFGSSLGNWDYVLLLLFFFETENMLSHVTRHIFEGIV